MKPIAKYRILAIAAVIVLVFAAFTGWLLGTSGGAGFLLREISRFTSLTIEAKYVEGRLWDEIRMQGMRVTWLHGTAEIVSFGMRWHPKRLFAGKVIVDEIAFQGVHVQDNRPEEAQKPEGPQGAILTRLEVRIPSLQVETLDYRRLKQEPVRLAHLSADIRLSREAPAKAPVLDAQLEFAGLDLSATLQGLSEINGTIGIHGSAGPYQGDLSANITSRVNGKSLTGEVTASLVGERLRIDRFAFRGPGLSARASGELDRRITVSIRVSDLSLITPAAAGSARAEGWVRRSSGRLAGAANVFAGDVSWNGMKAASVRMTAALKDRQDSPFTVSASAKRFSYNALSVEEATLSARGRAISSGRFDLSGRLSLSRGLVSRHVQDLELKAVLSTAELTWVWRGEEIRGGLSLVMAEQGKADADFRLPVPARLPVSVNRGGPLSVSARGTLHENGTLSYLLPGLIQESRGRIMVDVRAQGRWEEPKLRGTLSLDGAGAYVPEAGIHVTDVSLKARLEQRRLLIDSLSARSGPGSVTAKGTVTLDSRNMVSFEGRLTGERFQAVHLPEMHLLASPDVTFAGAPGKLSVRGEVRVPELVITGPPKEGPIQPSEDVVVIDGRGPQDRPSALDLDLRIKVVLGDHVTVKVAGVDALLAGETLLVARSMREITGRGEITVKKGRYRTYGVDLEITRGTILFPGGPIDDPTLDILALRTAGEVRAGVMVTGTLHDPLVRLYSEPAMPDADVLAYMVLGHPLGQSRQERDYLMQAAGVLLSAGQSASLQDQLKRRTGLDTIEVQTGDGEVARSLVTVGKYLSPRLYVSYGRSLFTGADLFRMRYQFTKRWELETRSGETSGVDLYYTIQID